MRLLTWTSALCLVLSSSYAFAGPGSGEPRTPGDPESGRPAKILDKAKCGEIWSRTEREGDTLAQGKAAPFVVNFALVDTDDDGKLSEAEFKEGCKQGLVQEGSSAQPAGKIVPKEPAMEQ